MPSDKALPADEFVASLRAHNDRYWHAHPFHERLHAGDLDEESLRDWVANRWYYQKILPQKDAAIIANCPVGEVRRRWVGRILFQDGTAEGEGGLAEWLLLADAVGLERGEVLDERRVVPGVRFAADAYLTFARTRPWEEAVAASLTELFSPDLMADRLAAIRAHYPWVKQEGLRYFEKRKDAARDDAGVALDLVVGHCRTRAQQEAAVAALSFKCDVLWSMLDALEHARSVA
jgi:pyrroloquinoline-quinone synthase